MVQVCTRKVFGRRQDRRQRGRETALEANRKEVVARYKGPGKAN